MIKKSKAKFLNQKINFKIIFLFEKYLVDLKNRVQV